MELLTASAGAYPRVADNEAGQELRRAYGRLERGEVTEGEFGGIQDRFTLMALHEQERAGLDVLTDGLVRWYDPFTHFARGLAGLEPGGLLRYFDTNTYIRQPVVKGDISWRAPVVAGEYAFAAKSTRRPVKPLIPGPFTLAAHTLDPGKRYHSLRKLAVAYGNALAEEVNRLAAAGAKVIQIDEPAILRRPKELPVLRAALEPLAGAKGNAALLLQTYFGDAAPLYDGLLSLPVDAVGLDFTYGPGLAKVIGRKGARKMLGLGLVDARNTRMERPAEAAAVLKRLAPRLKGENYLSPTTGLEYLPRDRAERKLRLLTEIKRICREG